MPGWKREEEGCSAYGGWAAELREERNPFSSAEGGKVSFFSTRNSPKVQHLQSAG